MAMQKELGDNSTNEDVKAYLWKTLDSGKVVPGYGHAVLRKPDPRFAALMDFAATRPEILADPVFRLVHQVCRTYGGWG